MSQKKTRAFFTCPRWSELAASAGTVPPKVAATLAAGKPVARSTLRKALTAAGHAADADTYIIDSRVK